MPVDPKTGEATSEAGLLDSLQATIQALSAEVARLSEVQAATTAKVRRGEDLLHRLFGRPAE
jgi:hypothetical protein